jgi:hypothetical protein
MSWTNKIKHADLLLKYAGERAVYETLGRPDVLLGIIPLYNVQVYEVALSQDELKFRAVSDNYLGDQEGKRTGIRLDFKLIGPLQEVFLSAIELLYLYCKGKGTQDKIINILEKSNNFTKYNVVATNTILDAGSPAIGGGSAISSKFVSPSSFESFSGQTTVNKSGTIDYFKNEYGDQLGNQIQDTTYNHRRTFMLMSKTDVLYKIFLQTYIYRRSIENGMNVITCSVFLRRYDEEKELDVEVTLKKEQQSQINIDNEIKYEDFLQDNEIEYDYDKHAKDIERVFMKERKSFISLQSYAAGGNVSTYNKVEVSNVPLYNGAPQTTKKEVTRITPPKVDTSRMKYEFVMKTIHRVLTAGERMTIDNKTGYLQDQVMLDMGLLNGIVRMTEKIGYGSDLQSKNLSWVNK